MSPTRRKRLLVALTAIGIPCLMYLFMAPIVDGSANADYWHGFRSAGAIYGFAFMLFVSWRSVNACVRAGRASSTSA